jgi:hypothetical protein
MEVQQTHCEAVGSFSAAQAGRRMPPTMSGTSPRAGGGQHDTQPATETAATRHVGTSCRADTHSFFRRAAGASVSASKSSLSLDSSIGRNLVAPEPNTISYISICSPVMCAPRLTRGLAARPLSLTKKLPSLSSSSCREQRSTNSERQGFQDDHNNMDRIRCIKRPQSLDGTWKTSATHDGGVPMRWERRAPPQRVACLRDGEQRGQATSSGHGSSATCMLLQLSATGQGKGTPVTFKRRRRATSTVKQGRERATAKALVLTNQLLVVIVSLVSQSRDFSALLLRLAWRRSKGPQARSRYEWLTSPVVTVCGRQAGRREVAGGSLRRENGEGISHTAVGLTTLRATSDCNDPQCQQRHRMHALRAKG